MREEVALKVNLPESRIQVRNIKFSLNYLLIFILRFGLKIVVLNVVNKIKQQKNPHHHPIVVYMTNQHHRMKLLIQQQQHVNVKQKVQQ
jgi:hypothetical protein